MSNFVGTVSRGIKLPIVKEGDDLAAIVAKSVLDAAAGEPFALHDRDVVAITESVVARTQGNYATVDDIAADVRAKLGGEHIGVVFPILSRNRFSVCLKGIAKAAKKVTVLLSYPSDEVGNHLIDIDRLEEAGINPWSDVLTAEEFHETFGTVLHPFTGVDYLDYYAQVIRECGAEPQIVLANKPAAILQYTKRVLACDIHTRQRTCRQLKEAGAEAVCSLSDILNQSAGGCGYNEQYGLLGSNKATETSVKLFPRDCDAFVQRVADLLREGSGKRIEVMVYGDGAFKDPVGQIWELADPVVSPAHTAGLDGTPNEVKLKYLADNDFADLSGEELQAAIRERIAHKKDKLVGDMAAQGTTPRRLTDLIGSLCDLTSGSGDKGTPVVLVQNYFDNYAK